MLDVWKAFQLPELGRFCYGRCTQHSSFSGNKKEASNVLSHMGRRSHVHGLDSDGACESRMPGSHLGGVQFTRLWVRVGCLVFFFLLKTGVKICHVLPEEGLKLQAEDQSPARLTSQPGPDSIPRVPRPRSTCLASWSVSMEDHACLGWTPCPPPFLICPGSPCPFKAIGSVWVLLGL